MPLAGQTPVEFWAGLVLAKLAPLRRSPGPEDRSQRSSIGRGGTPIVQQLNPELDA